jgi:hypothetical protein
MSDLEDILKNREGCVWLHRNPCKLLAKGISRSEQITSEEFCPESVARGLEVVWLKASLESNIKAKQSITGPRTEFGSPNLPRPLVSIPQV